MWGSTYLAIRVGVETIPPLGMAGVRNLVAGVLLYSWSRMRGAPRPTRPQWTAAALVGALLLLVGNGALTWAEQRVPSGIAALLVATEPLWVVVLAWRFSAGARPTALTAFGLALGLLGVALLVGPELFRAHGTRGSVDLAGAGMVLVGAASWAGGSLWSSRPGNRSRLPASTTLATGMQMVSGGAMLTFASLLAGEMGSFSGATVSGRSVAALGYLILFGSLVGFNAYAWLLAVEPPARVATYAFVNPVIAVLLGWGLAGELLSARVLVAAAAIVGAVVLLTMRAPAASRLPGRDMEVAKSASPARASDRCSPASESPAA
ncbi:MAG: EamA family transporter [bacterium]